MTDQRQTCPLSRREVIDAYFLEHRAKLIDLAAFLDRVDRAAPTPGEPEDFRLIALRKAITLLDDQPHRAKRILESFSDHTDDMPQTAAGMKGAAGAPR
jgi:hypothetical protein